MTVRRIGSWKDTTKRFTSAALVAPFPGGWRIASVLARVDGYLLPHEGLFLYWLARCAPGDGVIVEIGSLRGRSTLCLAAGIADRGDGKIVAIDADKYGTNEELQENLTHFSATGAVTLLATRSTDAAMSCTDPVRLCFIDGDHEENAVRADVEAWLPHVRPGGFLLLHDSAGPSNFDGPKQVAEEVLVTGETFEQVGRIGSITFARRAGGQSEWAPPVYGRAVLDRLFARYGGNESRIGV